MDGEWEYTGENCPQCGTAIRSATCWQCFGDGEFDEYEEDPINSSPGDFYPCEECKGKGELVWCPNCGDISYCQCDTCEGKGIIPDPAGADADDCVTCPHCHGDGTEARFKPFPPPTSSSESN